MSRTLCDWSRKDIERDLDRLAEIVGTPRFVCRKCARSASEDRYLCKPRPLPGRPLTFPVSDAAGRGE